MRRSAAIPFLALALSGCASPGVPRPPSLQLPEPAKDLHAARIADRVVLTFTTPLRSTDGFALRTPPRATLCRAVDAGPCVLVPAYSAPLALAPGPQTLSDALPPTLLAAPAHMLSYQLTLFNARDRSDGPSDPVFAASGPAPAPVTAFRAEGSRDGIVLHWQPDSAPPTGDVLLLRTGPAIAARPRTPAPAAAETPHIRRHKQTLPTATPEKALAPESSTLLLRAAPSATAADPGGSVDATALADTPYTYTALRSRSVTIGGQTLELRSDPSALVALTLHATFPPDAPLGLTAAAYPADDANFAVDLIWQPATAPDIAGYIVFRQLLPAAALPDAPQPLNISLLPTTAFTDRQLARGRRARYTVIAVDKHGNRSTPSTPAEAP